MHIQDQKYAYLTSLYLEEHSVEANEFKWMGKKFPMRINPMLKDYNERKEKQLPYLSKEIKDPKRRKNFLIRDRLQKPHIIRSLKAEPELLFEGLIKSQILNK